MSPPQCHHASAFSSPPRPLPPSPPSAGTTLYSSPPAPSPTASSPTTSSPSTPAKTPSSPPTTCSTKFPNQTPSPSTPSSPPTPTATSPSPPLLPPPPPHAPPPPPPPHVPLLLPYPPPLLPLPRPTAQSLHSLSIALGLDSSPLLSSSLVAFYSKSHLLHSARQVFDEMPVRDRDVVLFNVIIKGYAQTNSLADSFSIFAQLHRSPPLCPNGITVH